MTQDAWSGDEKALFNDLEELVSEQYPDLSPARLEGVLLAFLQKRGERNQELGDGTSSGWTGRISSGVVRPFIPNPASAQSSVQLAALPSVEITADTPARLEGILHQVLQIGAVLVQLDPKPALNELVAVSLEFPKAHLSVQTEGRVVHQSDRGTAIEVSGLAREDRLALQAIRDAIEQPEHEGPRRTMVEGLGVEGVAAGAPPGVMDSIFEPGAIAPVRDTQDPNHSFAPFGSRRGPRRMMPSTGRRRVDLPDPDMHVAESTLRTRGQTGATREFYGPPPKWLTPTGDADRIEELAGERALDILLQLSENGFTGVLVFEKEGADKEQYVFDSGYVVERSIEPRVAEEELGPMLQAADRITKRQLAMAAAHADELGMTVARSLMELGILNPDELRHAIAGRLTFLLREFCDHTQGTVRIFDSHALPAGFLPQPPLRVHAAVERVIYERFYRRLSQFDGAKREARMEAELDAYPEVIAHERDRLERAVTQPDQRRLLDRLLNGRTRLREVLTESALAPVETFAVIYSLHRMGLVRFDHSLHATVVRERMRENVTVKYLSVHKASYFEVLNVHWSSYSEVVEKAYRDLLERFDPSTVPEELEEEVHQRVSEIRERVEAAFAALAKRKTRHAYRTRIMPEYKLAHAIPLFLKQSELAERRGHWADARDAIRRVLEIDPDHDEGQRRLLRFNEIIAGGLSPDPADTNQ